MAVREQPESIPASSWAAAEAIQTDGSRRHASGAARAIRTNSPWRTPVHHLGRPRRPQRRSRSRSAKNTAASTSGWCLQTAKMKAPCTRTRCRRARRSRSFRWIRRHAANPGASGNTTRAGQDGRLSSPTSRRVSTEQCARERSPSIQHSLRIAAVAAGRGRGQGQGGGRGGPGQSHRCSGDPQT